MDKHLTEIKAPIAGELREFEAHFRASMKSHVPLLDKIMYYIIRRKGKRVRPMFVFLSARICGEVTEKTYVAASLIELLHTATLVHDDVVDDAHLRRGFFSINALWKNKIAVLVGDYLLSRGLLLAVDNDAYALLSIVSRAVKEMSEGELLQMEKARRLDVTEDVYYAIIRQKTASLIAASCAAGAASTAADALHVERLREIGETIGIAFQIKDDLMDYSTFDTGKPRATDIKEKKLTLPLIHTLQHAPPGLKRRIMRTVKNHGTHKARVQEVIDAVKEYGGISYTEQAMYRHRDQALRMLEELPDSEARQSLAKLVHFVTERKA